MHSTEVQSLWRSAAQQTIASSSKSRAGHMEAMGKCHGKEEEENVSDQKWHIRFFFGHSSQGD